MPATEVQRSVIESLGFAVSENWEPPYWSVGAFDRDGMQIVVRHLPYLPDINAILSSRGFRWEPIRKEWIGSDRTDRHVEVVQALKWCSKREYKDGAPTWAEDSWGGKVCPVVLGTYE